MVDEHTDALDLVPILSREKIISCFLHALKLYNPDIICDVGSFDGQSALAFSAAAPKATTIAFEANPENFFALCLSEDMIAQKVSIQHMAISDRDGIAEFVVPGPAEAADEPGHIMRGMGSLLLRPDIPNSRTYTVAKRRLDGFFGNFFQDRTFALWIDVEGHTRSVLHGAKKILMRSVLVRLKLETVRYWQGQAIDTEIIDIMRTSGFRMVARTDPALKQYVAIFLHYSADWRPLDDLCRSP